MSQVPPIPKDPSRKAQSPRPVGAPMPPTGPRAVAAAPVKQELSRTSLLILAGLIYLVIVAYFDMLSLVSAAWKDGLYSHGWIVPLFALALLWMRWQPQGSLPATDRKIGVGLAAVGALMGIAAWYTGSHLLAMLAFLPATFGVILFVGGPLGPVPVVERWVGVLLVAVGLSVRLWAAEYGHQPVDQLSFLPTIFGIFTMVGGFNLIRWAWPALAFLVFMMPLPNVLERPVLGGLQKFASICSTFVLQTLGMAAFRQGNLISIPGTDPLNIAEACSGLRMGTIFGAMAVFMVFIIERPWWDKFVILLSAIPIALLVNIIRITVIGLLYWMVGPKAHIAQKLGHDWAGLFMMPLALGFLWLELQILERLTIPIDTVQVRPVGGARGVSPIAAR
jgi:exosortase